jgi:farnesyl diphosphate synthase
MCSARRSLEDSINNVAAKLFNVMDDLLPEPYGMPEDKLFEAMRYSTMSPGKRLRPYLLYKTGELFGVDEEVLVQVAAVIEFIHVYSLIHDDLPAIDDDDFRRGLPSCHKKYGEATAILAGDALLTLAFEILADGSTHRDAMTRMELVKAVAQAAGYHGLVGGQIVDIAAETHELDFSEIVRLQRMKTGALFSLACEAGAILGHAPKNLRNSLRAYANNIGIAFQITDDLLDVEGTREETGKDVKKDAKMGKATLASCIGIEKAKEHAAVLAQQAVQHLSHFDHRAERLRELAYYVIDRSK